MAIIVEEEKKKTNFSSILGWVLFLVVAGIAVYYIFFFVPQAAIVSSSQSSQSIASLSQLTVSSQSVTSNPTYQTLKQYIPSPSPQGPTTVGRTNPFIAP